VIGAAIAVLIITAVRGRARKEEREGGDLPSSAAHPAMANEKPVSGSKLAGRADDECASWEIARTRCCCPVSCRRLICLPGDRAICNLEAPTVSF